MPDEQPPLEPGLTAFTAMADEVATGVADEAIPDDDNADTATGGLETART